MGSEMQQGHLQNQGYADSDYNDLYVNTMQESVCGLIDSNF